MNITLDPGTFHVSFTIDSGGANIVLECTLCEDEIIGEWPINDEEDAPTLVDLITVGAGHLAASHDDSLAEYSTGGGQ